MNEQIEKRVIELTNNEIDLIVNLLKRYGADQSLLEKFSFNNLEKQHIKDIKDYYNFVEGTYGG